MLETFAFYNVENLFDINNSPTINDSDFTLTGRNKWTLERYSDKIEKLSKTISLIGKLETDKHPLVIGLAEVENKTVLKDLLAIPHLPPDTYEIVHYNSLDERGIDNALLYRKKDFKVLESKPIRPPEFRELKNTDRTRDILYVKGSAYNKVHHIFIVHFPSHRKNNENQYKRELIVKILADHIAIIQKEDPTNSIIVMGDFNDLPTASTLTELRFKSDKESLTDYELFNPMLTMAKEGSGSINFRRKWLMFDQMLFSKNLAMGTDKPQWRKTSVFKPDFLKDRNRNFFGNPFRTFAGKKYLGGYSDHFPVYSILDY